MPCNELNSKEVHAVPPPINLDVTGHGKPPQGEEKLPIYAIRFIRRLLNIADADFTNVSIKDRDLLEEALSGTSLEDIARRNKVTRERIRQRVNKVLDFLGLKVSGWENQQKKLHEMGDQLKTLQEEAVNREKQIEELSRTIEALKTENGYLHSVVNAYSEKEPKPSLELIKVEEKTRKILCSSLSLLGVPRTVAFQFASHNIHTVLDIIRYTDRQLAELDGVSDDAVAIIKQALDKYDLKLGADIRWVSYKNDYYLYPKNQ